jgi:putative transposase
MPGNLKVSGYHLVGNDGCDPTRMPDGAPRASRFDYKGVYRYSLTICAHRRCALFVADDIIHPILKEAEYQANVHAFAIRAYCFMPDHLHVLVEGRRDDADLRRFVKAWKQRTGFEYKQRTGHALWQVGYFDHVLRSDESTHRHVLYILGNPIRAGLATTIGEYRFAGCEPEWL